MTRKHNMVYRFILSVGLGLAIGLGPGSALSQAVDPEADGILKAMSSYLGGLSEFSVEADLGNEIIDLNGQKLQYSTSVKATVQRPGNLHVARRGPFAGRQLFFNGQTLILSVEEPAIYREIPAAGDIDSGIATLRAETGFDAPAGDLFYTDPYAGLLNDVVSGVYNGTAFVQGIECHHLAFRARQIDWQIWIQVGDTPLPMKYVITSKWITGAPQFSARFRNWNQSPEIGASSFTFAPPEGARKIESIPVNAMGELMPAEDQQ